MSNIYGSSYFLSEVISPGLYKDNVWFFFIQMGLDVVFNVFGPTSRPFLDPRITILKAFVKSSVIDTFGDARGGDKEF